MTKIVLTVSLLLLVLVGLAACDHVQRWLVPATPTAAVFADWFFHGCAFVDANGNEEIDTADEPLKGAMLLVGLKGGVGFGSATFSDGCATVTVPGGLSEDYWPVTLRMNPPPDTDYELVGPTEFILEYPESRADFLFVHP